MQQFPVHGLCGFEPPSGALAVVVVVACRWVRGAPEDFDRWEKECGCEGWGRLLRKGSAGEANILSSAVSLCCMCPTRVLLRREFRHTVFAGGFDCELNGVL